MSVSAELRVGSELLGYRVERVLGRGGMGVVYLAHQLALDRMVALKLLAPELAQDEAYRDRFLRESRLAASLEHPNIVPVHDAGEVDGRLYIAMRYVEGSDLRRLLDEDDRLASAGAIRLLRPVAEALDAAHARGLVHRDVKPSNILVDQTGRPYLADFGLTKQASERGFIEQSHFAASLDYVAPEQIERQRVGPAADVYSLGCVLHECLTGEPPYRRGSQLATLWAHVHDPPPKPTDRNAELPDPIDAVIARALAKEPDERYPTCHELAEAARQALGVTDVIRVRSRPLLLFAAIGLTLAIGAGVAAFLLSRGGGTELAGTTDSLIRIDPATNRVAKRVRVGAGASAVAVGGGAVWVASIDDGAVWRVDIRTGSKRRIVFPEPNDVVVAGRGAYVAERDAVGTIDAASGTLLGSINLGAPPGAGSIAAGKLGIWTVDQNIPSVDRLFHGVPLSGGLAQRIPIQRTTNEQDGLDVLSDIAVGNDAVWATGDPLEHVLFRVDPTTRSISRFRLPGAPGAVTTAAGAVWVAGQEDDVIWSIRPQSGEVADTIPVGRGASDVAFGEGSIWVTAAIDGTVYRIDPARRRVVATIKVGGIPEGIAIGAGGVWVASRAG